MHSSEFTIYSHHIPYLRPVILLTEKKKRQLWISLTIYLLLILGGCTPDLESNDPEERIEAVQQPTFNDQIILTKLAFNDKDPWVRIAAVIKLAEPTSLAKIAIDDDNSQVRYEATHKITDLSILKQVALQDVIAKNRILAVSKISDQNTLLRIAGQDEDVSVKRAAIKRLTVPLKTSQTALAKISQLEKNDNILIAVIKRLTNAATIIQIRNKYSNPVEQAAEKRIADDDIHITFPIKGNPSINNTAIVKKITDQKQLLRIALDDKSYVTDVQYAAVRNITNRTMLARIAKQSKRPRLRDYANARLTVEPLNDQTKLIEIAKYGKNELIRRAAITKLTDQAVLADIALNDENGYLRIPAMRRLNDNSILEKIAYSTKPTGISVRSYAAEFITDQTILLKIVNSDLYDSIRRSALRQLTDQDVLFKIATDDRYKAIQPTAIEMLNDQRVLSTIATHRDVDRRNYRTNVAAIKNITDSNLLFSIARNKNHNNTVRRAARLRVVELAKDEGIQSLTTIAVGATDISEFDIRNIALLDLMHAELLTAMAYSEKNQKVRTMATHLLEDQGVLRQLAENDPAAHIREAAIVGVSDDAFLLRRVNEDISAAVRLAAVRSFQDNQTVLAALQQGYYIDVRTAAYNHILDKGDKKLKNKAKEIVSKFNRAIKKLESSNDSAFLINEALNGKIDVIREVAASWLKESSDLKHIAITSKNRGVLKVVLNKIEDAQVLKEIANTATTPSIRLAATQKSGQQSWEKIFHFAMKNDDSSGQALGDALAAVSLFKEMQPEAKESVHQSSLQLIRMGNEARIPEMVDLLMLYGNPRLAEDYLNCGQPDLNTAATAWASAHGYNINTGGGSNRARWGESNR